MTAILENGTDLSRFVDSERGRNSSPFPLDVDLEDSLRKLLNDPGTQMRVKNSLRSHEGLNHVAFGWGVPILGGSDPRHPQIDPSYEAGALDTFVVMEAATLLSDRNLPPLDFRNQRVFDYRNAWMNLLSRSGQVNPIAFINNTYAEVASQDQVFDRLVTPRRDAVDNPFLYTRGALAVYKPFVAAFAKRS